MLKQYTFLALVVAGCASLILAKDANTFGQRSNSFRVFAQPVVCTRSVTGPATSRASVLATVRAHELRCRVTELRARVHGSIARLQAEKQCMLNSFTHKLADNALVASSPAWRDIHYDAQVLAQILGLCKQMPV